MENLHDMPYRPYFQTTRYRVQAMVNLAEVKPDDTLADLGSGDGRILLAFASIGIQAHGFELDDALIKLSEENIFKANMNAKASVYKKDFWQVDLSGYSIITIYPMPDILVSLEKKLLDELSPGSRVLVNYYPLPTWKQELHKDNIYLYRKF